MRCRARRTAASAVAQKPAETRNGTTSPVAAATAPPAAGPISAPIAHAAFIRPKAMPCGRPAPLGALGDQREGRGEERAVRSAARTMSGT